MPTGFTYKIKDGISFEEFIMRCTRAFSALVCMRASSIDSAIPKKFEPESYHKDAG